MILERTERRMADAVRQCNATPESTIHSKSFSLKTHFCRNTRAPLSDAMFARTFLIISCCFFSLFSSLVMFRVDFNILQGARKSGGRQRGNGIALYAFGITFCQRT